MKISEDIKSTLLAFLQTQRSPDLLTAYLFYLEKKFHLSPAVYLKEKTIYQSGEIALKKLGEEGKVWRETEIKIGFGPPQVNERTRKIYICPFTGKVFADNTHPNPQDAIYDWVSRCPENTERLGGVRAKRFFVSEDPEVIKNYIKPQKEMTKKTVYSSATTGKLFNTKAAVIRDFQESSLKPMDLADVQSQNRFQLEDSFLQFIQDQLQEEKIASFVETLAEEEAFHPYVNEWVESE
ncbi:MAG: hypothetical protein K940chlam9_00064 [Chlamydiae bacterium]|nr:hypothetical protein [Chlamydiota bacterium]